MILEMMMTRRRKINRMGRGVTVAAVQGMDGTCRIVSPRRRLLDWFEVLMFEFGEP
jgi:hypothetical protein